jgi:hypothetical protein
MDQRLYHFAAVTIVALRDKSISNRAAERKTLDSLRSPIGGDFLTAHSPDLFRVALKENTEEAFSELIAYPFFKIPRTSHRQ